MAERASTKIALVTGGNRGIGLEVCRQLAVRGMRVFLGSRDFAAGEAAAAPFVKAGLPVRVVELDVTRPASIAAAAALIRAEYGRLDVLVNNAGGNFDAAGTPSLTTADFLRATMELNLVGALNMLHGFLPLLCESASARVVNVSSGAGSFADPRFGIPTGPGVTAYSASKAALNALTVKTAAELKPRNILVNAVCPGFTATQPGMAEMGARPVVDGAASVVWAAVLPDDGPTGGFFRDGKPLSW